MKTDSRHLNMNTPSCSGFTLLEMMIALAIIAITLTAVLHTVNFHVNIMADNTMTTRMYQLAKEKMIDLESAVMSTKGKIEGTPFTYENIIAPPNDSGLTELNTIIRSPNKRVSLKSLVVKKEEFSE